MNGDALLSAQSPAVYTDFSGLSALRHQAAVNPDQAIEKVAGQFESIFLQMMMKSMRDASIDGGLFDSNQLDLYQSMFDQQTSLDLSAQGTLGLADMIVQQLSPQQASADEPVAPNPFIRPTANAPHLGRITPYRETSPITPLQSGVAPLPQSDWRPETPEQFIRGVRGHAVEAAGKLGVDPAVLVAQSALETGWGAKIIRKGDGGSSFNLFGIKAGGDWTGDKARVSTLEYRDGVATREFADFRAYSSLSASFEDYVAFLTQRPRYQQALNSAADGQQYLTELQQAGYATDPQYAAKIINILENRNYSGLFAELKDSTGMPLPTNGPGHKALAENRTSGAGS